MVISYLPIRILTINEPVGSVEKQSHMLSHRKWYICNTAISSLKHDLFNYKPLVIFFVKFFKCFLWDSFHQVICKDSCKPLPWILSDYLGIFNTVVWRDLLLKVHYAISKINHIPSLVDEKIINRDVFDNVAITGYREGQGYRSCNVITKFEIKWKYILSYKINSYTVNRTLLKNKIFFEKKQ